MTVTIYGTVGLFVYKHSLIIMLHIVCPNNWKQSHIGEASWVHHILNSTVRGSVLIHHALSVQLAHFQQKEHRCHPIIFFTAN